MNLITSFDMYVLHALYSVRVLQVSYVFIGFTEFGGVPIILGLTTCTLLALWLKGRYAEIAGLLFVVGGSGVMTYFLKHLVHRARPDIFYRAYPESGFSFPSGHATDAAAFYGFAAFLIIRLAPDAYRRVGAIICGFFVLMIGFSRLYLGVHFFSDVVAGFAVGFIFLALSLRVVGLAEKYFKTLQATS